MEHDDVIIPLKTIGVFRLGSYTPIDAKLYTLADLENAREDTRVKCKEAFIDGYESGHNDTVESRYGCSDELADNWIYDNFGPVSSIEERVRRETVEKVIANGTLITQGEPMCEWEVLSIDRETLTAIAEGGEG